MNELLSIGAKGFWCGCAAVGFAILFNAPVRSLFAVWLGGFIGGIVKYSFLNTGIGAGMIASTLVASLFVGVLSIPLSKSLAVPDIIIAIPSVIPLVPGVFAYKAMMGLIKLARFDEVHYSSIIGDAIYNGVMTLFVVCAIVLGLVLPLMLMRKLNIKVDEDHHSR